MLSDLMRQQLRRQIEQNLTQTCTIERPQTGTDAYGGAVDLAPISTTSACHLSRMTRTAADMIAMADAGRVYYKLQLPHDANIEDGDEVVIGDERYRVEQAINQQTLDLMRQAVLVLMGS